MKVNFQTTENRYSWPEFLTVSYVVTIRRDSQRLRHLRGSEPQNAHRDNARQISAAIGEMGLIISSSIEFSFWLGIGRRRDRCDRADGPHVPAANAVSDPLVSVRVGAFGLKFAFRNGRLKAEKCRRKNREESGLCDCAIATIEQPRARHSEILALKVQKHNRK